MSTCFSEDAQKGNPHIAWGQGKGQVDFFSYYQWLVF
jgi:hypothetical protein